MSRGRCLQPAPLWLAVFHDELIGTACDEAAERIRAAGFTPVVVLRTRRDRSPATPQPDAVSIWCRRGKVYFAEAY